jgi:hypothetical protein
MVYNGKSYENPMKMDDLGIYVHIKDLLGFISSSKPGDFEQHLCTVDSAEAGLGDFSYLSWSIMVCSKITGFISIAKAI